MDVEGSMLTVNEKCEVDKTTSPTARFDAGVG